MLHSSINGTDRVKTFGYKLMNEVRLLWRSLFFYNNGKAKRNGGLL